ncbi:hypothetical protein FRC02_008052 [Tulasnella sp. 418]|nr:hypothetical protein FRC02_008052 [Tulasnella sp. 418]
MIFSAVPFLLQPVLTILSSLKGAPVSPYPADIAQDIKEIEEHIRQLEELFPGKDWVTNSMRDRLQRIIAELDSTKRHLDKMVEGGQILPNLEEHEASTKLANLVHEVDYLTSEAETKRSEYMLKLKSLNPKYRKQVLERAKEGEDESIVVFESVPDRSSVAAKKRNIMHTGSWSVVYECQIGEYEAEKLGYTSVAYKVLKERDVQNMVEGGILMHMAQRFKRERDAWNGLEHQNIAPLLGVAMQAHGFVSPWYSNGSLHTFCIGKSLRLKVQLLKGTAEGLAYLHSKKKIHGDLKPPNVLVDDSYQARLIDFGGTVDEEEIVKNLITESRVPDNRMWMAPERFGRDSKGNCLNLKPSQKSDVYCFGLVCISVITEQGPYPSFRPQDLYDIFTSDIFKANPEKCINPPFPTDINDWEKMGALQLWHNVQDCWAFMPKSRPTMETVVKRLRLFSETLDTVSCAS